MNHEQVRSYMLELPQAREDYPFGPDVIVMKVADKMFAQPVPDPDPGRRPLAHESQVQSRGGR